MGNAVGTELEESNSQQQQLRFKFIKSTARVEGYLIDYVVWPQIFAPFVRLQF
jgi:hypothetical protein|tara:strand:- start:159 stop:317 length:159 start_codon:yes stop_codon:yes gene_type:complete